MVSLGAAQSKVSDTLGSAVAGNPNASVRVESEIVYTADPCAGTEVVSETTNVIVEAASSGDSLFVFPPAPDTGPDGGSAFSHEELSRAFQDTDVSVFTLAESDSLEEVFFGQTALQSLQYALADATTVFVNSSDQLAEVLTALPVLADDVQPLVVVAPGIELPENAPESVTTLEEFSSRKVDPASELLAEAGLPVAQRDTLLGYLEDSGELALLEEQVEAQDAALPEGVEVDSVFSDLTLPQFHEAGISLAVKNGTLEEPVESTEMDIITGSIAQYHTGDDSQQVAAAVGIEEAITPGSYVHKASEPVQHAAELIADPVSLEEKLERLVVGLENDSLVSERNTIHFQRPVDDDVRENLHAAAALSEREMSQSFAPEHRTLQHTPEYIGGEKQEDVTPQEAEVFQLNEAVTWDNAEAIDLRGQYMQSDPKLEQLRRELGLGLGEQGAEPQIAQSSVPGERPSQQASAPDATDIATGLAEIRAIVRQALSGKMPGAQLQDTARKQAA